MDNQRNIIMAVVLTALILFGWDAAMRHYYPQADKPQVSASGPVAAASASVDDAKPAKPTKPASPTKPDRPANR